MNELQMATIPELCAELASRCPNAVLVLERIPSLDNPHTVEIHAKLEHASDCAHAIGLTRAATIYLEDVWRGAPTALGRAGDPDEDLTDGE